jgi:sulfite reductase beta subunit-like hemoprotein/molybdopterin converting factor small subunit
VTTRMPARPRRADRPAPDWDLVLKRNYIERLKQERPPMHVRDELPELIERGYEDIPEEDMVRFHWWGLAHDKPKIGTFMVRVKVAGGLVQPAQLKALGAIAREYGRDEAELTTRQGIQLHWVHMSMLPEVLAAIEAAGLTTCGAEGDTIRNITGCPVAGLSAAEPFDVMPVIQAAAEHFWGKPEFSNLPRKHKYTISACPDQCNAPEIHDVALVGTVKDGEPGFGLRVGGGMANTPRISRDVGVFVPFGEAVEVLQAVTNAWQRDLRCRVSRAKARIKFMMDDYGPEGVRAKIEEQLGRRLPDGAVPEPTADADHMGVAAQRQPGLSTIGVPVPAGRVTGSMLEELGGLLEDLGADARFTRQQNFILGNVPTEGVGEVQERLAGLGLPTGKGRAYARSIACTSHRFCNYSVAETKGKLDDALGRLTTRFGAEQIGDLSIHLDGCPHACAQHWVGEIGLQGTTASVEGAEERIEAYDLTVGGGLGKRTAIGRRLLRRVPTDEVGIVLERLVGGWLTARGSNGHAAAGYTFGDFATELSDEALVALATGAGEGSAAGSDAGGPADAVLHVPGPLLSLVGGADEIRVSAATVGEVLAAVSAAHPAFAETMFPGGQVAEAFLITVGDDDIRNLDGLATPVTPGTDITIVMAMSGG